MSNRERKDVAEQKRVELVNGIIDFGKKHGLTREDLANTEYEDWWHGELLDYVTNFIEDYLREYGIPERDYPNVKGTFMGCPYKENSTDYTAVYFKCYFDDNGERCDDIMIDYPMLGFGWGDLHNFFRDYIKTLLLNKDWYEYNYHDATKRIVDGLADYALRYFGDKYITTTVTENGSFGELYRFCLMIRINDDAPEFYTRQAVIDWLTEVTDWTTIPVTTGCHNNEIVMNFRNDVNPYEWCVSKWGRK